jgi:hypothetical protein
MRKYLTTVMLIVILCAFVFAQVTTPNLQLQLPARGTVNYDVILNSNFSTIDTAVGILQNAFQGNWINSTTYSKGQQVNYLGGIYLSLANANFNNIPASSPVSWLLMFSAAGTVSSVGDAPPLFTVTSRTSAPAFVFSNASANTFWAGPASGSPGSPLYRALVSADLPGTIAANTTGNANSATTLQTTPTLCGAGNFARGIDTFGNGTGCTAATGSGPTTFTPVTHQFLTGFNSGTNTFSGAQAAFTDVSGIWTKAQAPASNVYTDQANTYTAGMKQIFGASTTTAGMSFGGVSADPSGLADGDHWYRTDLFRERMRANGVTQSIAFLSDVSTTFAPSAITGFGSAGNYLRSTGSAWAASTIQGTDVPTLNQNTTGTATGDFMNWNVGPIAGTISVTAGTILARTTLPSAVTVKTFTMFLGGASAGCTTLPTYQLFDNTASTVISTVTLVNGTAYYNVTGVNTAVVSGHDLVIKVGVTGVACSTPPAAGQWTAWYTM